MTHREARKKLGSRSRRRAGTNGKNLGILTTGNRAVLRRYPRRPTKFTALGVRKLMKEANG